MDPYAHDHHGNNVFLVIPINNEHIVFYSALFCTLLYSIYHRSMLGALINTPSN